MTTNITTFSREMRIIGGKPQTVNVQNDFYIYQAQVGSLAPNATLTDNVAIEADADFIIERINYMTDIAGASQTFDTRVVPLVRCQIQDTGSGRQLFNEPIDLSIFAGFGSLPALLTTPRRFSARSVLTISFTNYSAATTYANLSVGFIGRKSWML